MSTRINFKMVTQTEKLILESNALLLKAQLSKENTGEEFSEISELLGRIDDELKEDATH